jgi:uncharacterized protein YlaN (UPF0358 family)
MRILTVLLFLTLSISANAQQHSYDYIVNQYCKAVQEKEILDLPKDKIIEENIKIGRAIRQENSDTIDFILKTIHQQNDTLSEMQTLIVYSKIYIHTLIYGCSTYLQINRKAITECPKETKSLQYIALRIDKYLTDNPNFTYQEVLDSTGTQMFYFSREIPKQIEQDYGDEFMHPMLIIQYLLHKNDTYFKAWLYMQTLKIIE